MTKTNYFILGGYFLKDKNVPSEDELKEKIEAGEHTNIVQDLLEEDYGFCIVTNSYLYAGEESKIEGAIADANKALLKHKNVYKRVIIVVKRVYDGQGQTNDSLYYYKLIHNKEKCII